MSKILIVNDVALVNKIMKKKLEGEGEFIVDAVMLGKEGIQKSQENNYDIILLDFNLPDINGDEVCMAIKNGEMNSKSPIYFISAMDKDTMAIVIKKTGANGYLDITVDITELAGKIKGLIA